MLFCREEVSGKTNAPTSTPSLNGTSTSSSGGGNWFDFGGDTKAGTSTSDNWASVFDSQPSQKASSEAWGAAFSSQKTATTPAGIYTV